MKARGVKIEVVFVSSDRSQDAFDEYYGVVQGDWLALPFDNRKQKEKLSSKYGVRGIPTVVMVDVATGQTINENARTAIESEDPQGHRFPWDTRMKKSLWELLGNTFLKKEADEGTATIEELRGDEDGEGLAARDGRTLLLYFGGSWCPPCQRFCPKLVDCVKELREADKNFECVHISWDEGDSEFEQYFAHMPGFFGIKKKDPRTDQLGKLYKVEGIPTVILVDAKTGETINDEARNPIEARKAPDEFPWRKSTLPPILDLNDSDHLSQGNINDQPLSLMLFVESLTSEQQRKIDNVLKAVADTARACKDHFDHAKMSDAKEDVLSSIWVAKTADEISNKVRDMGGIARTANKPHVLLLALSKQAVYHPKRRPAQLDATSILQLLADYHKPNALLKTEFGEEYHEEKDGDEEAPASRRQSRGSEEDGDDDDAEEEEADEEEEEEEEGDEDDDDEEDEDEDEDEDDDDDSRHGTRRDPMMSVIKETLEQLDEAALRQMLSRAGRAVGAGADKAELIDENLTALKKAAADKAQAAEEARALKRFERETKELARSLRRHERALYRRARPGTFFMKHPRTFGVAGDEYLRNGRVYFEVTLSMVGSPLLVGWVTSRFSAARNTWLGEEAHSWAASWRGELKHQDRDVADRYDYETTWKNSDVIGCAADLDAGKLWWGKNGEWALAFEGLAPSWAEAGGLRPAFSMDETLFAVHFGPPRYEGPEADFQALHAARKPDAAGCFELFDAEDKGKYGLHLVKPFKVDEAAE